MSELKEGAVPFSNSLKQMSDGRVLDEKDVADYKRAIPEARVVEQQTAPTAPVSRKLTQGGN